MVLTGARPSGISVPRTAASGRTTKPRSAKTSKTKQRQSRPRAAHGTLLPEHEYEAPLLRALVAHGGSAPASQVIEDMGAALADRFTEADRETLDSGLTRWKNRVQFVRLRLVQAGQVKKDSPRGIWEVTSAGRERVDGFGSNE
ncbi:MAG: winged helix-turn-helix domain-containing protein [Acidimicrobiales bacterium]